MAEQQEVKAVRIARWSARSCALAPVIDVVAFVLGCIGAGHDDDASVLAATMLFLCFMAVFFGLVGLFMLALARDLPGAPPRTKWAAPCGIAGILGGFILGGFGVGLFGLTT
jgi:hypothetical protein